MLNPTWQHGPAHPTLAPGEVAIWRVPLAAPVPRHHLNEDEQARAARFRFPRDRNRFTIARAALRDVLGRYLGMAPGDVIFSYGAHGKPGVAGVHFNLSHAGEIALLAVSADREVGIDVEYLPTEIDVLQVARQFFPPAEAEVLAHLPEHERKLRFYTRWTQQEAYLKALGTGLATVADLSTLELPPDWTFLTFTPDTEYLASFAIPEKPSSISWWEWQAQVS
ncbi:MAG: 4'-phosphopantetheinyl transferase family protein [Armatimonadota bacterium]